ncbi:hypothetical protein A4G20_10565 [Pasteurellaceae bacterium RH1A]|nr:hypothetical protein A4G20_10565 [Pasteurellaceae bacterium RH1A]
MNLFLDLEQISLEDLALIKESSEVECKLASGQDGKGAVPKDLWETYSAFANTQGGYIILGMQEKKNRFVPVGIENIEQVKHSLFNIANSDKVSCNLLGNQDVREFTLDGKTMLCIYIRRAKRQERPVYLNNNPKFAYHRVHESDHRLSDEQLKRMLAEQIEDTRDNHILKHYGLGDLNLDTLKAYRQQYNNLNPANPSNELDNQAFLQKIGAYRLDRETGEQGLTVAGLLMFGEHTAIQEKFPYYMLDYQERPESNSEQRWVDRLTLDGSWSGNLYDFAQKVYRKLVDDLKVPFRVEKGSRQEDTPVHIALREALANVIIHADYTGRASVLVVKRPDMYGFRNPGLMRIPLEIALQGGEPDCRNRLLAQMFRYIKFGDQAGSGIPHILSGWKSQHWQTPLLREVQEPYEQTILELKMVALFSHDIIALLKQKYAQRFTALSELERTILIALYSMHYLTHQQICLQTTAHSREITLALAKLERFEMIASSGEHKSKVYHRPDIEVPMPDNATGRFLAEQFITAPKYPELSPDNPELSSDNPELNPDSAQNELEQESDLLWKKLQRLAQPVADNNRMAKADIILVILEICREGYVSLNDLAQLLKRKPDTLRKNYLNPLVISGQLKLAYPATKNHPKQAYMSSK